MTPLALLVLLATAAPPAPPLAEHPAVAPRLELYRLWIEDQRAHLGQPGVSVGIVHGGELVWARGFGFADLEARRPTTPETVYRIGSITKTFTATALVQLAEAGGLRLDDPVAQHLPGFAVPNRFPGGTEITLRHLLTHTSGLPRDAPFPYWTDRRFPTREQMLAALAGIETLFEPGTNYQYSNLGLALAGEVVAAVSGQTYAEYVRRRVLEPLGMDDTLIEAPERGEERVATGYLIRRSDGTPPEAPPTEARGLTPSANMSSTVADLARFLSAQFAGGEGAAGREEGGGGGAAEAKSGEGVGDGEGGAGRLLSAAALREMHRVHWLDPSWASGRGLGFSVWREGERTLVGHGGWVAGHRSQIAFDPKARIGVVVLTNSDQGGPGSYVRQAFRLVVPAIEGVVAPAPEVPGVPEPERYTGTYHTPWGEESTVLVLDGRLVIYDHGHPPSDDPEGSLVRLVPEGEHAFRKERPGAGAPPGERVVFEITPDGRVARVKVGENYLFPADCGRIGEDLRCTWD